MVLELLRKKGKGFVLRRKHCKIQFIARNQGTMYFGAQWLE